MDNPNDIPQGTTPQSHDTSIQAVRLAERNRRKETMVQSIPDDASPAPASTATAFTSTAASATTATTATTAAVEEQEQRDFAVVGGSPKTVAVDATAARGTAPTSAPPSPPPSKKIKSKKSYTHSDIRFNYYDPSSMEEVYEFDGVWYLVNGYRPVGHPWRRHGTDWRPTPAEDEEYQTWYKAFTATVIKINKEA